MGPNVHEKFKKLSGRFIRLTSDEWREIQKKLFLSVKMDFYRTGHKDKGEILIFKEQLGYIDIFYFRCIIRICV